MRQVGQVGRLFVQEILSLQFAGEISRSRWRRIISRVAQILSRALIPATPAPFSSLVYSRLAPINGPHEDQQHSSSSSSSSNNNNNNDNFERSTKLTRSLNPPTSRWLAQFCSTETRPFLQVVALTLLLVGGPQTMGAKHPQLAAATDSDGRRAPRGYCARVSRILAPKSRCFEHLASGARHQDQLVYVRAETVGDSLSNLSVTSMNERLLGGLLERLGLSQETGAHKWPAVVGDDDEKQEEELVRAQIAGSAPGPAARRRAKKCQLAIEKFACRFIYPVCHFRSSDAGALVRPPCREDCLLLRDSLCENLSWRPFTRLIQRALNATLMSSLNALNLLVDAGESSASTNSLHFYWPHERSIDRCESLPPLRPLDEQLIGTLATARRRHHLATCSASRLTETIELAHEATQAPASECAHYLGPQNTTKSGLACQSWAAQQPHEHKSSELLFNNMRAAGNQCRNPGGLELAPWCYTTDPAVRWQFCDIPTC